MAVTARTASSMARHSEDEEMGAASKERGWTSNPWSENAESTNHQQNMPKTPRKKHARMHPSPGTQRMHLPLGREVAHAPITGNNEALAARLGCPLVKW